MQARTFRFVFLIRRTEYSPFEKVIRYAKTQQEAIDSLPDCIMWDFSS